MIIQRKIFFMSKVSISKSLFILAVFFAVNLNAKEKQIGYFDSLAVLKDLPSFEWIDNKLEGSILLELYQKDIEDLKYAHEQMSKQLDSMRDTLTDEEVALGEKELAEVQL